jgi:hypothetical protein
MEQRAHAWITVRAVALLEDEDEKSPLVEMLKPHIKEAAIGSWIPDKSDAKRMGNRTDNHIFKITEIDDDSGRFVTSREELVKRLGEHREMAQFLGSTNLLDPSWWGGAYKADTSSPGKHSPNRANGLSITLKDLLILGDEKVDNLLPGNVLFIDDVTKEARTRAPAAVLYMTMLSHFLADACMPCHSDARNVGDYGYPKKEAKQLKKQHGRTLHEGWEGHWKTTIGTTFDQDKLRESEATPEQILDAARAVDAKFAIAFKNDVPLLDEKTDVWLDTVNVCRAAFAIASIVSDPGTYVYNQAGDYVGFGEAFSHREDLLKDLNRIILHDATLNTAIVWKDVWKKVSKE